MKITLLATLLLGLFTLTLPGRRINSPTRSSNV